MKPLGGLGDRLRTAIGRTAFLMSGAGTNSPMVQSESPGGEKTLVFHATRLNATGLERKLRESAEHMGLEYSGDVGPGVLFQEVTASVSGEPSAIERFSSHAEALTSTTEVGGGGTGA